MNWAGVEKKVFGGPHSVNVTEKKGIRNLKDTQKDFPECRSWTQQVQTHIRMYDAFKIKRI